MVGSGRGLIQKAPPLGAGGCGCDRKPVLTLTPFGEAAVFGIIPSCTYLRQRSSNAAAAVAPPVVGDVDAVFACDPRVAAVVADAGAVVFALVAVAVPVVV